MTYYQVGKCQCHRLGCNVTNITMGLSYNGKKLKPLTSQPKNQSLSFIVI